MPLRGRYAECCCAVADLQDSSALPSACICHQVLAFAAHMQGFVQLPGFDRPSIRSSGLRSPNCWVLQPICKGLPVCWAFAARLPSFCRLSAGLLSPNCWVPQPICKGLPVCWASAAGLLGFAARLLGLACLLGFCYPSRLSSNCWVLQAQLLDIASAHSHISCHGGNALVYLLWLANSGAEGTSLDCVD